MLYQSLGQIPIFSFLEEHELKALTKLVRISKIGKGGIVFNHGEHPASLHLLIEGQLKSVRYNEEGKEAVLHIINKGEPFAVIPAYLDIPYTGTAIAVKSSQVGKITRQDFLVVLKQHPEIALKMMGTMAQRTENLLTRIEDQTMHTPLERIVRYLLRESQTVLSPSFNLSMTKNNLAKTLGTTPETLSRCFAELSRNQVVHIKGKKVTILDEVKLLEVGRSSCEGKKCWSKRCQDLGECLNPSFLG